MEIKTMSDDKLKSLAFDTLMELQRHQSNLQVIQAELENRKKIMENETPENEIPETEEITTNE